MILFFFCLKIRLSCDYVIYHLKRRRLKVAEKRITSTDIKIALKDMHSQRASYFITECKTCSTYFPDPQGLLKFDGLAITKSYTKPNIIGYEIKVSRGDFLQDNKWHLYLQYCNEFYFVVPKGLVSKEELPEGVGLIYYNPEAKQVLKTVKKALYRQIDEPVGVYKYIIFSRLDEDRIPFYEDRAEYVRDYLADKVNKKYIGTQLGSKMAKDLEEANKRLDAVKHKEVNIERWEKAEKLFRKYDLLGWSWWDDDGWLKDVEEAIKSSYPKELDSILDSLKRDVSRLEKIKEGCKADDKG